MLCTHCCTFLFCLFFILARPHHLLWNFNTHLYNKNYKKLIVLLLRPPDSSLYQIASPHLIVFYNVIFSRIDWFHFIQFIWFNFVCVCVFVFNPPPPGYISNLKKKFFCFLSSLSPKNSIGIFVFVFVLLFSSIYSPPPYHWNISCFVILSCQIYSCTWWCSTTTLIKYTFQRYTL